MAKNFGVGVGVRVARLLYRRWEALAPSERDPLEPLAADLKERALEARGKLDGGRAARELEEASSELRAQLKRELERAEQRQRERPAA